ncbi:conserved hypothetical protein protein (plasmid) [Bacillus cereus G9241]|uniref:Uncharacterized protein n=2 Tax=Bacillaceae TaxID=186817 RepID=Q6EZT5_BACAN|nr:hypothetical protein BX_A0082 [Bacillus anthracis str. A2012]AAT28823.2 conserved hypothetical protein [Bacillus anthracis str. 'Ames Ancestor']EAL12716.1 conserved hypothetical protein protein [Bacillus cereus G9241]
MLSFLFHFMEKGGDRMDILFTLAIEILKVIAREVAVFVAKRVGKSLSTSWKQIQRRKTKRTTHNAGKRLKGGSKKK